MGAYLSCYAPYIPWLGAGMATGAYDIPAAHVRLRAAYTNTVPVDAYRGAGRPEASYLIERLVDAAARELGIAPDALAPQELDQAEGAALHDADREGLRLRRFRRHAGARAGARRLGRLSASARPRPSAPASCAASASRPISRPAATTGRKPRTVRLDRDGGVTVLIGSQSTGQGHATSYAQLVAERLDLPPERVRVVQGDTDLIATGAGTGGSSSIPVGGVSVDRASKTLAEQLKQLAADALEAAAGDMEIADGTVRVAGTDRAISFADLAAHPQATPEKLARGERVRPRAADLSERHPYRRGRDRSRDRRDGDRRTTSWSTISAPRSIRCCSPARCMAAPCRASARR